MDALNPFHSKSDDIDLIGRFVNLFVDFSPLCDAAQLHQSIITCTKGAKPFMKSRTNKHAPAMTRDVFELFNKFGIGMIIRIQL